MTHLIFFFPNCYRPKVSLVAQLESLLQVQSEKAARVATMLLRALTNEEVTAIHNAVYLEGPRNDVIATFNNANDKVRRHSMHTLRPKTWLNDEVINFYYKLLGERDELECNDDPNRKRNYFATSHLMAKLLAVGHASDEGMYDYSGVKTWFKNVNIFEMDKIFVPINHGHMHWICAVICMTEKKICMYDSMGSHGMEYLEALLHFINDEHISKKGVPLHDIDEWELVGHKQGIPSQDNGKQNATYAFASDSMYDLPTLLCHCHIGVDCGVFTCMFADFLSRDLPIVFSQEHINQCRNLIALSILRVSTLT